MNAAGLSALRDHNYRRTPDRRVHTINQAVDFINEVGFAFFWPIKGVEAPNLFHAICGRARDVPRTHSDPDLNKSWRWKDESLGGDRWFYAKVLRRRATLISWEMLPYFYAASDSYGEIGDYIDEYEAGELSAEARRIYQALLENGPLDVLRLRREARLAARDSKSRFERALVELQIGFKIFPVGVAEVGAWDYGFVYDLVLRRHPELPEMAGQIRRSYARQVLVSRYLDTCVAATPEQVRALFHVLRWTPTELRRTLEALIEGGRVRLGRIDGLEGEFLISLQAERQAVSH